MSLPLLGAGMATDGFSPLSISGLQFWVDAADSATLYTDSTLTTLAVSNGDDVGGWKDKSGNSRDALQTDGTKKPMLMAVVQNGRNIARFDGVNDLLTWSNVFSDNPCTFFGALKSSWTAGDDLAMGSLSGALAQPLDFYRIDNIATFQDRITGLNHNNAAHTFCVRKSSAAILARMDGTAGTSGAGSAAASDFGVLGAGAAAGTYPFQGDIFEILIYNSVLSVNDILLVEAYLKAKWGTP